jgi:hypothetical protein
MAVFQRYFNDESSDEERIREGGPLDFLGRILDPIGIFGGGGGIPGLLGGGQPPPAPLPQVPIVGSPVITGTVSTPAGPASVQLQEPAASLEQLRDLEGLIRRDETRINSLGRNLTELRDRVGVLLEEFAQDTGQAHREGRSEQRSQGTMAMMMPLLLQRRQQRALASHTHTGNNQVPVGSQAQPASLSQQGDTFLLMLPFMMGGMGGGRGRDDDNSMMMMMMLLMLERE